MNGTTGAYLVYLLADWQASPYGAGTGGQLAVVMEEVKDTHRQRINACGDKLSAAFCLVWFERMETQSAARSLLKLGIGRIAGNDV